MEYLKIKVEEISIKNRKNVENKKDKKIQGLIWDPSFN